MLAIALADTNPLVWGGSALAARAARRVAESIRRASGQSAIAGDAEHLLPVIEAARPRDVFDDPFADDERRARGRCCWSSTTAPTTRSSARTAAGCRPRPPSTAYASRRVTTDAATEVARYASLLLSGRYARGVPPASASSSD